MKRDKKNSESQTKVDPRDMLNKFCFHLYAQKSLFRVENCNGFDIIIIDQQQQQHPIL